ncbi:GntR family transcriptional regulator [Neobacillus massiliamazoniensis]|jgi:DNA-binding GntR family transcriptional regulator|uniref:GntR family transcriptional regulator n=1 Tax=Neobacillus massiliamazoniensis TaxID=1499688 RepID=A0A0U1NVV4_9BACI|nr:GntR family transcriptional regulator [Neobacillus massiliamazoniensis]CRK82170.1 GntR family transcriptional regulator [Neobacillus massiliamazoniensis]
MHNNLQVLNKPKKPLFVIVYDQLYKLIMDGTFPPDSQLPTEPELAKIFGVSRMTLRHALALLQEDGLVKNIHGKGNFITKFHHNESIDGLEKLGNPLYKCYSAKIDDIELNFRIDLVSDYAMQVLDQQMTAVVALERWYKNHDKIVAYAFTMMPIESVSKLNLDLHNEKQVLEMLEEKVYELANSSTIEIKRSNSVNTPSLKYQIFYGEECDLILESVYISDKYPVVYNKYYIPTEFSQIKIKTSK